MWWGLTVILILRCIKECPFKVIISHRVPTQPELRRILFQTQNKHINMHTHTHTCTRATEPVYMYVFIVQHNDEYTVARVSNTPLWIFGSEQYIATIKVISHLGARQLPQNPGFTT